MNAKDLIKLITKSDLSKEFEELNWSGDFSTYLNMVIEKPEISRTAFQRIYDMIAAYGFEETVEYKKKIKHYKFFEDPIDNGKDAVFGLDIHLQKLVNFFNAAAHQYGPEKRVMLLHGPVGLSLIHI